MKYLLEKDKKKRISFYKTENKLNSLSYLLRFGKKVLKEENVHLAKKKNHLETKQFGKCFVKNRCIFTNRSKAIYKMGRISRIKFRSYALFGYMTGIQKSSW